ncbi:Inner membrane protein YidH [Cytospora mali]|uniref:Inner membrane protein YidH n=1 Tax=Cytospora mali TaxID=578113 RepID=A0A194VSG0_CYTMA|nr:Inner membrane protein YidH [Valsa mali]
MLSRFAWKTPIYQNTGSTARDHLASERTFLAWIRTGLGFLALGIAIERFSQLDLRELLKPLRPPPPQQQQQQQQQGEDTKAKPDQTDIEHELEKEQSQVLVGALMGLGSGSIVYGTSRYFSNLKLLERGLFKPSYHGSAILAASVAGLAGGVYGSSIRRKWQSQREREEMQDAR